MLDRAELRVDPSQPSFDIGQPVVVEGTVVDASAVPVTARVEAGVGGAGWGPWLAGPVEAVADEDGEYDVSFPGDATSAVEIDGRTGYEGRSRCAIDGPCP